MTHPDIQEQNFEEIKPSLSTAETKLYQVCVLIQATRLELTAFSPIAGRML